jgi:thiol-disulfide isomerase/thioredoxin
LAITALVRFGRYFIDRAGLLQTSRQVHEKIFLREICMTKAPVFAVSAVVLSLWAAVKAAPAASIGDANPQLPRKATPFGIQTGPGKYAWLSDYEGKTRVVAFILTTCPHCQFTTGILNKLQGEFANRGVQIIESAAEPMAGLHIADFEAKFHPAFPVGYNDQRYIAKFLGFPEDTPMFFPTIAMIDRKGMIRVQLSGEDKSMAKDIQEKSLRDAIEKTMEAGQTSRRTSAPN